MATVVDVAFSGWASALVEVALDKVADRLLMWLDDRNFLGFLFKESRLNIAEEIINKMRKLQRMFARICNYLDCITASGVYDGQALHWLLEFRLITFDADDLTELFQVKMGFLELSNEQKLSELNAFNEKITSFIKKTESLLDEYYELANTIREVRIGWRSGGVAAGTQETSPFLCNSLFVGMDDVKQELLKSLHDCRQRKLSIIRISGSVGIGKTALARQIFNDDGIKKFYQPRLWVSMDKEFDVKQITAMILESVCGGTVCRDWSLCKLQELLHEALTYKCFLIVLDGEWHEKSSYWEKLFGPLQDGHFGSVVVVTTRSVVLSDISNISSISLNALPEEDCSSIFWKQVALEKSELDEEVIGIGEKVVMKSFGNPLVAKALGDLLSYKMDRKDWNYILKTEISQLACDGDEIFSALRVCYRNMPAHLKPCFIYCGIFPRGYVFKKDTLILLWMAEGLIKSTGCLRMEDIGALWFDELVDRYFLEPVLAPDLGTPCFKMNELMREMVDLISGHDRFVGTMINEHTKIQNQNLVRHLLVICMETTLDSSLGFKSLRSLILLHERRSSIDVFPESFMETMEYIRVLDLVKSGIKEVPSSIKMLTLLRYLDLSNSYIKELPAEMGLLSMLQTLRIRSCKDLEKLPRALGNLGNLRHLDIGADDRTKLPPDVGRLTMLQELKKFNAADDGSLSQLENMVELHETLRIKKLENVLEAEEAERACLSNKEHLSGLELEWSARQHQCANEREVLLKLKPHHNLKKLVIKRYLVCTLPKWEFGSPSSTLVDLELQGCSELCGIGELKGLQCLKNLKIQGNRVVGVINRTFFEQDDQGFGSLESLHLVDWTNLNSWVEVEGSDFPRLKRVMIENCNELETLPDFSSFGVLVKLVFYSCSKLRFPLGNIYSPTIEVLHAGCLSGEDHLSSDGSD